MSNTTTISDLNNGANPLDFGVMLGDDGCNQLWLFRDGSGDDNDSGLVANRYVAFGTEEITWSNDVTGWNYNPETDCIPD